MHRFRSPLTLVLALACGTRADVDLSTFIGATHWSPCYFLNASLPSLHDGAAALAASGTRAIKLTLAPNPEDTYPWNTNWSSILAGVHDLGGLAATPIWDAVLRGAPAGGAFGGGWNFTTFSLISYRLSGSSWNYWCDAITEADIAAETSEFKALALHLLSAHAGSGKTFFLEHWEGDWSAHCGNYDASKPPSTAVQGRMIQWLAARQAGVDAGRAAWCALSTPAADCANGAAIHMAAGVRVLHASEVNLLASSMDARALRNNVLGVLPYVSLDAVSYSSYDTMWANGGAFGFGAALDFLAAHHNRSSAAPPPPAVFIAEYGLAQVEDPDPHHVAALVRNVNAWALSDSPVGGGARRALASFYWELFDNEVDVSPAFPGGRCNAGTGPEFNASRLHGFWLLRPDESASPSWDALVALIRSGVPPVPEAASCTFEADTDWQGDGGGDVTPAADAAACCAACAADARCVAARFKAAYGGGGSGQ